MLSRAVALASLAACAHAQAPRFDRDVRPILAAKCFACHGPDAGKRKAGLRLDRRDEAIAKGALAPGDAAASELIHRIEHQDPDERMPPPASGPALSASERATLRAWLDAGAEYEPHWAFAAPVASPVPACASDPFVRSELDAHVLAALRARGLTPSPEAPRVESTNTEEPDAVGL